MLIWEHDGLVHDSLDIHRHIRRPDEPEVRRWRLQTYDRGRITHAILVDHLTKTFDLAALCWRNGVVLGVRHDDEWNPLQPTVRIRQELIKYIEQRPLDARPRRSGKLHFAFIDHAVKVLFLDRHYWVLAVGVETVGVSGVA